MTSNPDHLDHSFKSRAGGGLLRPRPGVRGSRGIGVKLETKAHNPIQGRDEHSPSYEATKAEAEPLQSRVCAREATQITTEDPPLRTSKKGGHE